VSEQDRDPGNIFQPFSWKSLAWAALIESAVRAGETVLDIPSQYNSVYSVLAGQGIEAVKLAWQRAKRFVTELLNHPNRVSGIPENIRPHVNRANAKEALHVLDEVHAKWLQSVDTVLRNNPLGMKAGVKPWQVL